MAYKYKKSYRIQKRKLILRNRFFGLGFLAIFIIAAISYLLFFSDIFHVNKIIVTGTGGLGEEDIKTFLIQKNIFLIDAQKIEKEILANFPRIAKAEVSRGFPDAISIAIAERLPVAIWCGQEKCFLMDKEAVTFDEAGELALSEAEGLIKIMGSKEMLGKEKIAQIMDIQIKLKYIGVTTTQAFIVSDERLDVKNSEGWEIYFNLKGDLDWQIQELSLVLEKQITPAKRRNLEYVDLRFSRVYYK